MEAPLLKTYNNVSIASCAVVFNLSGQLLISCYPIQMRRFEKVGLTRAQSEQMTEMLTEVVCTSKEKIAQQFVSKPALEKVCLVHPSVHRQDA